MQKARRRLQKSRRRMRPFTSTITQVEVLKVGGAKHGAGRRTSTPGESVFIDVSPHGATCEVHSWPNEDLGVYAKPDPFATFGKEVCHHTRTIFSTGTLGTYGICEACGVMLSGKADLGDWLRSGLGLPRAN